MHLTVRTYQDIRAVPEAVWDEVATPGSLLCTHRFLRGVQEAELPDCRFFFPLVLAGEKPVGHACMYLVSSELDMFGKGFFGTLFRGAAHVFPALARFRSLECGVPVALGNTLSVHPSADRAEVLEALVREARRLAAEHRVDGILFRDFTDAELPGLAPLERHGFRRVPNLPQAVFAVRWREPEQYVAALRAPYRRAFRQRRAALARGGVSVRVVRDFAPLAESLAGLWRQVYDHAREYRREVLPPAFFARLAAELGAESEVLLLERHGNCLAFALLLEDGGTLIWLYCGLDYEANGECDLYFNLLYEIILHGMRRGFRRIDLGITTLDAKKRAGAEVRPLHMYMRHRNPLLRSLAPALFRLLTPGDTSSAHQVFKDSGGSGE